MRLYTFASSSGGNCLLVQSKQANILLDFGISFTRTKVALEELGLSISDINAIFITHEHIDHVSGVRTLVKKAQIPIYGTPGTLRQMEYRIAGITPLLHPFYSDMVTYVKDVRITSFATSHDSSESQDYVFWSEGHSIGCMTDTGIVTDSARKALEGCDLLYLESNHDVDKLMHGVYPYTLQQRILSDHGHLSNEVSAAFAAEMAALGTKEFVLAHLSAENNTPELALQAAKKALAPYDVRVSVAARARTCGPFFVGE